MATSQAVETSVTNNSSSQGSNHPDDLFQTRCLCYSWVKTIVKSLMWLMLKSFMDFFKDESLRLLLDHLRINSSTDIGSMIVSEAGLGHVEKLKNLLKAHPEKVRGF